MKDKIFYSDKRIYQGDYGHVVKKPEIIEARNVIGKIVGIDYLDECTFSITIEILNGQHKGQLLYEEITTDHSLNNCYKYYDLRNAVGKPREESESVYINPDELFMYQLVHMNLSKIILWKRN